MRKIFYFIIIIYLLFSCNSQKTKEDNVALMMIESFKTIDSAYYAVPSTVLKNSNTFVNKFVTNDSLCVVNVSSGCIDNHLYIYNLNTKVLLDSVGFFNEEELRDFVIIKNNLYVLLNDYKRKTGKIIKYNFQLRQKTDSNYVFVGKKGEHIYVNKFFKMNDMNSSIIYFLLTTGLKPNSVFPLVGSFNTETKKVNYKKYWYPYIKDIGNKEYYVNDNFTVNQKLYIAYETTPYCSEMDLLTNKMNLVRNKSFLLDSIFKNNNDSLEDIYKKNYSYFDNNQCVVIDNKDYIFRHLSLDENKYGSDVELLSIVDTNLNCVGEQLLYYFRKRENYLSISFTQKLNDSLNISCYVYNNKLVIKKGTFKIKFIKLCDYFNQLDSVKKDIENQIKEACPSIIQEVEVKHVSNNVCDFNDFLKKKNIYQNKKNLLLVSLNTCPTCVKSIISWYYENKNLFLDDIYLLVVYKNDNDLERINDLSKKYDDFDKIVKKEKALYINKFFSFDKPFILINNINNCSKSEVNKFETSEMDSLQNQIVGASSNIILTN